MSKSKNIKKVKQFLIRRQTWVFIAMLAVGFGMLPFGSWHFEMIIQGIAFIIVGFVGLLMSWTTDDIGKEIKKEIRTVGREVAGMREDLNGMRVEMREGFATMNGGFTEMNSTLKEIREILKDKN